MTWRSRLPRPPLGVRAKLVPGRLVLLFVVPFAFSAAFLQRSRAWALDVAKQWYVARILAETGGNEQRAAELLGVDRRTLYRMLARNGPDEP